MNKNRKDCLKEVEDNDDFIKRKSVKKYQIYIKYFKLIKKNIRLIKNRRKKSIKIKSTIKVLKNTQTF